MMQSTSTRLLFSEIKVPLLRALQLIRPHFSKIRIEWRKKLGIAGLGAEEVEALMPLALEAHYKNLAAANFEAYCQEIEQHAQVLQGKGLVGAHAILALGLYLEALLFNFVFETPAVPAADVGRVGVVEPEAVRR